MNFRPRTMIKGQALVVFIAEFTYSNVAEVIGMASNAEAVKAVEVGGREDSVPIEGDAEQWTLYVDGASIDNGSRTGMMLISPKGHKIHCAIHFGFKASNNEAEYEALIAGLRLMLELRACNVKIFSNSQLVVN